MPIATANGVDICYEVQGDPANPTLLLIHGHGAQLIAWHEDLVKAFVALGLYIVQFDNRDAGLSTHLDGVAVPDFDAMLTGDYASAAYLIDDMADDAAGLLEAIGRGPAHIFGVSMGGMIAQAFAIRHPGLTRTLTSVMSSPDPVNVGTPTPEAMALMLAEPATTREGVIDQSVRSWRLTGSPALGIDEVWIKETAGRQYDRAYDPAGVARQFGAIVAAPDRRPGLRTVRVPTLVVHGEIDPLVTLPGGEATAEAVEGAELLVIKEMGHDLPRAIWPTVLDAVGALVAR